MIIVRLKGGLGNQMFQYAAGKTLALKNNTELRLDISYFDFKLPGITRRTYNLDVFNISAKIIKTSFLSFVLRNIFDRSGYFQSPKYFEGYEEIIRKDFTLRESLAGKSAELLNEIKNCASVGVHVRRGDYVGNKTHPVLGIAYYKRGIEYISSEHQIDKIYIFSDDIEWCEKNIQFGYPVIFVGEEHAGKYGENHLILLSACKNLIIANSTYSWWSAWLSENQSKIVVAPQKWFADDQIDTKELIPENWVRL